MNNNFRKKLNFTKFRYLIDCSYFELRKSSNPKIDKLLNIICYLEPWERNLFLLSFQFDRRNQIAKELDVNQSTLNIILGKINKKIQKLYDNKYN